MIQIDSTAAAIGTSIGVFAGAQLAAGMGIATKFLTDLVLKIKDAETKLPSSIKPFIALAVSMGLSFANSHLTHFGGPVIGDETAIPGLLSWGVGMGFHSLISAFGKKKTSK